MTELKRVTSRDFKLPIPILFFFVGSNMLSLHTKKGGEVIRK